jgi:hypothetical protein
MPACVLVDAVGSVCGVRMESGTVLRCSAVVATDAVLLALAGQPAPSGFPAELWPGDSARVPTETRPGAATLAALVGVGQSVGAAQQESITSPAADPSAAVAPSHCAARQCDSPIVSGATSADEALRLNAQPESAEGQAVSHAKKLSGVTFVARAIALLDRPVVPGSKIVHIVLPPGSCGNTCSVTAWQSHSSAHTCPDGHILLYLSTPSDGSPAADLLRSSVNALLATHSAAGASAPGRDTAGEADATPDARESTPEVACAVERGAESSHGEAAQAQGPDALLAWEAAAHAQVSCDVAEPRSSGAVHRKTGSSLGLSKAFAPADEHARAGEEGVSACAVGMVGAEQGCTPAPAEPAPPSEQKECPENKEPGAKPSPLVPPSVCVLCFYTQAVYDGVALNLPKGLHRCSVPGCSATLDDLAEQAEQVFGRLFPGCGFLEEAQRSGEESGSKAGGHGVGDEEEEQDPLEAALKALGLSA